MMNKGVGETEGARRGLRGRHVVLQALLVGIFFVAAVWLGGVAEENAAVRMIVAELGYAGIFVISVASGFNLAVPVPVVAFLPLFLGAGFAFWPTLIVMTIGMTLGDGLGFFIGNAGRRVAEVGWRGGKFLLWFESIRNKFPRGAYLLLFLYAAFVPAPNELLVIPMSFARYRFRYMIPLVLLGNFLFNTLVAFGILFSTGVASVWKFL